MDYHLDSDEDLKKDNQSILQICRNRWSEGIYNIAINDMNSHKVVVKQG